nr:recombinase [bacterium]
MPSSKNKKLARQKADRWFSKFIRLRDTNNGIGRCITCGANKPFEKLDCGHFISRRFEATRYDERNAHAQCLKCNRFQHGNQFQHAKAIDRKYGEGTADNLHVKSKMICRRKKWDYEYIAEKYRNAVRELE